MTIASAPRSALPLNDARAADDAPPFPPSGVQRLSTDASDAATRAALDSALVQELLRGSAHNPHAILGAHPQMVGGEAGVVVRAFHPDAVQCLLICGADTRAMSAAGNGLFSAFIAGAALPLSYRLRFLFANGATWERDDPYRFLPTLGDQDLHYFSEGTHRKLWTVLGAHVRTIQGTPGVSFAVWAPSAARVSVVGDFNGWDGRLYPMRALGSSGVWEIFLPGLSSGALYKYEIKTAQGELRLKADPLAREHEPFPGSASRVTSSEHEWQDRAWLDKRGVSDPARTAMAIYEVHLGSWARVPEEGQRMLTYRELAVRLVAHAKRLGFTHLELLPIAEHAFYPSWGYQITGYYAPTTRYGSADDFRYFVDYCHQHGIGVLIDWVPAHFPKDDHALRRFDGSALYEHQDPRRGEHPDWGTLIFNVGRREVRNFLTANALYWLSEFHLDGLRVDAVASMLYLDFSRKQGEWLPNQYGGRENLEAVSFLQEVNTLIHEEFPGAFTVAEESTAWPGVTAPATRGGLGFDFKWNMGWMHDTLSFFSHDPIHRKYHLGQLTFAMAYEYSERFINAISHDEVVYGKRSLIEKMPGDAWQKYANLRLLLAYQYTRPGKKLLFMGSEFAQRREWNVDSSLDFHLEREPEGRALEDFLSELARLYQTSPALWLRDPDPDGFEWIDCSDYENTVLCYLRRDGTSHLAVILNFTPLPRRDYRVGVPSEGTYRVLLSSDDVRFGGSGFGQGATLRAEPHGAHGQAHSLCLDLPPLGALILTPDCGD